MGHGGCQEMDGNEGKIGIINTSKIGLLPILRGTCRVLVHQSMVVSRKNAQSVQNPTCHSIMLVGQNRDSQFIFLIIQKTSSIHHEKNLYQP